MLPFGEGKQLDHYDLNFCLPRYGAANVRSRYHKTIEYFEQTAAHHEIFPSVNNRKPEKILAIMRIASWQIQEEVNTSECFIGKLYIS